MASCIVPRPSEVEGRSMDEVGKEEGQGSSYRDGRRMDHGGATVLDPLSEAYLVVGLRNSNFRDSSAQISQIICKICNILPNLKISARHDLFFIYFIFNVLLFFGAMC